MRIGRQIEQRILQRLQFEIRRARLELGIIGRNHVGLAPLSAAMPQHDVLRNAESLACNGRAR